jgi:hypothetical protein
VNGNASDIKERVWFMLKRKGYDREPPSGFYKKLRLGAEEMNELMSWISFGALRVIW